MAAWSDRENFSAELKVTPRTEKYYEFIIQGWSGGFVPAGGIIVPVGGKRNSAIIELTPEKAFEKLKKLQGAKYHFSNGKFHLTSKPES